MDNVSRIYDETLNGEPKRKRNAKSVPRGTKAYLLLDDEGRIVHASARAEHLFGAGSGELNGRIYGFPLLSGDMRKIELREPGGARIALATRCTTVEHGGMPVRRIDIDTADLDSSPEKKKSRDNGILSTVIAYSPLAIVAADSSARVTLWNHAAVKLFGHSDLEIHGQRLPENGSTREDSLLGLFERVQGGEVIHGQEVNGIYSHDGSAIATEIWGMPVRNERGQPAGVVLMIADVSKRKKGEAHIRRLVGHDPLTGLPNRHQFRKQLQRLIKQKRHQEAMPILMMQLGLDRFRSINKSMGPQVGDQLLRDVSRRLAESLYETDLLARTGGDEFSILLRGTHHIHDGVRVAERLRQCIAEPFKIDGREAFLTASIGLAVSPDDGKSADALIRATDSAMERAKEQGGDNCQFFTRELDVQARNQLVIENELRHAIERNELHLEYQPQIDLKRHRVVGVEALVRWRHPLMGLIPPASFIPLAENSGQIESIGAWVLNEACRQLQEWERIGIADLRMSVNVSVRQFRDSSLRDQVKAALTRYHIPPSRLELELTESMLMRDAPLAIETIDRLKRLGVRLAIDDFGTGFSSLSYLADLPIDTLKIDQSFVRGADGQVRNGPIVRAICTLAAGLGLRTVAEGIESTQQIAFVRTHGCDEVQGFLLAKPMLPGGIVELIRQPVTVESISRKAATDD